MWTTSWSGPLFLHPVGKQRIPLERWTLGDVSRETYVLSATAATEFSWEGAKPGKRILEFEYGLAGTSGRLSNSAALKISDSGGNFHAIFPLPEEALESQRTWKRATVQFHPSPEGRLIFRPVGMKENSNLSLLVSCPRITKEETEKISQPNLILIVIDTLRRDYLGVYRSHEVRTPGIDRLAEESVVFENAFSAIPITQPSHFSMLTGLYPVQTGVTNNSMHPPEGLLTFQKLLKGYGYRTGAVVSVYALKETWGLGPGFDFYKDIVHVPLPLMPDTIVDWIRADTGNPFFLLVNFDHPHSPRVPPGGEPLLRITLNGKDSVDLSVSDYQEKRIPLYLKPGRNTLLFEALPDRTLPQELRQYDQRAYDLGYAGLRKPRVLLGKDELPLAYGPEWDGLVFSGTGSAVLVNPLSEPHPARFLFSAYRKMRPEVNRYRYARCVEEADRYVARVLNALKQENLLENTYVILTADHGEGLFDHGVEGHIQGVYAEQTRVPLLVAGPGIEPRRVEDWVSLVDLMPTLLDLLGREIPSGCSGTSFGSVLHGKKGKVQTPYSFSASYPPQSHVLRLAFRTPDWSYIRERQSEKLFRIPPNNLDWTEQENVSSREPEILEKLRTRLDRFVKSLREATDQAEESKLTDEEKEKLRALGYLH